MGGAFNRSTLNFACTLAGGADSSLEQLELWEQTTTTGLDDGWRSTGVWVRPGDVGPINHCSWLPTIYDTFYGE